MAPSFTSYAFPSHRVIGIVGAKPSVGATTSALALAALMTYAKDKTARGSASSKADAPLVIEGNLENPKVHEHLGIIPIEPSDEPFSLNFHDHIHPHDSGIKVITHHASLVASPQGPDRIVQLFSEAKAQHSLIFVPHTPQAQTARIFPQFDEVLFLTDGSHESITRLAPLRDLAKAHQQTILGVVLARAGLGGEVIADYIERVAKMPVIGMIPHDAAVAHSRDAYVPITFYSRTSPAAQAYQLLARKLG